MHLDRVNARRPGGWLRALAVYREPRMLAMLFLGFSSGLPFYLVLQTLTIWMREAGVPRTLIAMLAWGTIPYSLKFLWAPIVDRGRLPLLDRALGRRRSWMLVAQVCIACGLARLAFSDPGGGLLHIALWALFVAFFAATQDIAMDAWRIESAPVEAQGAMLAAYQVGFRVALITGSAGALALAQAFGWQAGYLAMALLTSVGIITTLCVREPQAVASREERAREAQVVEWLERRAHWPQSLKHAGEWFIGAVVCPLVDFFSRYGARLAVITLLFIGAYRLTEFGMGSQIGPFYVDHGYSNDQIATVVKIYGLSVAVVGVFIAGMLIAKIGLLRSLVLGSLLVMASNTGFALLATTHTPTLLGLGLANALDNLALAVQGTALLAFLSSLTSPKYTATQYALFSSLYALPGKTLEGFSGIISHFTGYPLFFVYTASLSVPGLLLLFWLWRRGSGGQGLPSLTVLRGGPETVRAGG
jgi:MFS transporter, PAT family, beta-lactamase induction signal transducer AmpG